MIMGLLVLGIVLAGFLFYRVVIAATQPVTYRPYEVSPPNSFIQASNPSVIDPEKVRAPMVGDALFAELHERARSDFAIFAQIRPPRAELLGITDGDTEIADAIAGVLDPLYDRFVDRAVRRGPVEIIEVTDDSARVKVPGIYQGDGSDPTAQIDYVATYDITGDSPVLTGITAPVVR